MQRRHSTLRFERFLCGGMLLTAVLSTCAFSQQAPGTTTCIAPPSGLVSWWPGDVGENDVFGQNNPAAVNAVTLVPAQV
jgi:hypothetical protein